MFREYFRRPEATERAFVDGWFLTGDTVARDERGYFKILGRTSVDILKSGGYKLSALEIEEALREHEAVSDVAVVGVPDKTWGEHVVACVVVRPGKVLEPEMLRAFAKERLASYKCPKDVVTMQELPRNAMGKVQKPALIATLLALLACGSPGKLGTSASPIVSGMADDGADTSVVAIFVNSGAQNGVVCSGTVVSPHVVLTAAHCLDEALVGPSRACKSSSARTSSTLPSRRAAGSAAASAAGSGGDRRLPQRRQVDTRQPADRDARGGRARCRA